MLISATYQQSNRSYHTRVAEMYAEVRSICWSKAQTAIEFNGNEVSTRFKCIHDCPKDIKVVSSIELRERSPSSVTQVLTQSYSLHVHKYVAPPTVSSFQSNHPRRLISSILPTHPILSCPRTARIMANVPLLRLLIAGLTLFGSLSLCMPTGISHG